MESNDRSLPERRRHIKEEEVILPFSACKEAKKNMDGTTFRYILKHKALYLCRAFERLYVNAILRVHHLIIIDKCICEDHQIQIWVSDKDEIALR